VPGLWPVIKRSFFSNSVDRCPTFTSTFRRCWRSVANSYSLLRRRESDLEESNLMQIFISNYSDIWEYLRIVNISSLSSFSCRAHSLYLRILNRVGLFQERLLGITCIFVPRNRKAINIIKSEEILTIIYSLANKQRCPQQYSRMGGFR